MGKRRGAVDESWLRTQAAFETLLARMTPWLLDLGNWIFGALIAFSLVIIGAMLTVGPVDRAVLVATAAFALALPLDVAGFFLLKLVVDMKKIDLETVATTAFVEAGFSSEEVGPLDPGESEQRRTRRALSYSYSLLVLTALLTLIGVTAALWHMAWWIGVAFAAMLLVSLSLVTAALNTNNRRGLRRPAK